MFEVVSNSHFYRYLMHRNVAMATVKVNTVSSTVKVDIADNLGFKVVCNSHFYNCSMHRSVVVATINMDLVTLPKILGKTSYYW